MACGQLLFDDPLRDDAVAFVSALKTEYGLRVVLASGDASPALAKVAKMVGLGANGEGSTGRYRVPKWCHCLPDGKADLVKRLKAQGERVVMIGDGMNDAAALAVADVAVAVGSNDLVASVSDVIVGGGTAELRKVLRLLGFSRRTLHIARRGVVGGMAVSSVQMLCAATGLLPPFVNAVLQECVDLSTVLHALLSPSEFV